jgi:hypothetical protein
MQHRLSTLLVSINFAKPEEVLTAELGISIPWKSGGRDWEGFFRTVELRDVLDAVTVLASNNLNLLRVLPNNGFMAAQRTLIEQQTDDGSAVSVASLRKNGFGIE